MAGINNRHPGALLIYFLSAAAATLLTVHPLLLAASLCGALISSAVLEGISRLLRGLRLWLPLILLIAAANPLFARAGDTALLYINGRAITLEALAYGLASGVMLASVMLWCALMSRTVGGDGIRYIFGRRLPYTALTLTMTLAFVPRIVALAKKTREAQRAVGAVREGNLRTRVRGTLSVFSAVLGRALEDGVTTARSMRARDYGKTPRLRAEKRRWTAADIALAALSPLLAAVCIWQAGASGFAYYPRITGTPLSPAIWAAALLLFLLPALAELTEVIKWRLYLSKI